MAQYSIAMVGSRETIAGFALLGLDVHPVDTPQQAVDTLMKIRREKKTDENGIERSLYAIIFITEDLASAISPDDERKLSQGSLPAIIPLPSHHGSTGYGLDRLKRIVERAVGSNILK